jgi:hypothetical protein
METEINSYERDRQRRSNLRQIEVVRPLSNVCEMGESWKSEGGEARPGATNANYRNTNTTARKHKGCSKL